MKTIAITGKGGTGKSTIAASIIFWLSKNISHSILAVDADSNVNLNLLLDVELKQTIGAIREEMRESVNTLPGGMTKQQFLEYKIQSSLVETANFDLVAMGRPEGPGCYCYANNLLRDILKTISDNYDFIIIDNEAGMEHLSRRTTQHIDYLMIVSDPSVRGIKTAGNISRLLKELETRITHKYLILNRVRNTISQHTQDIIQQQGLELLFSIPEDDVVLSMEQNGESIRYKINDLKIYQAIDELMKKITGIKP